MIWISSGTSSPCAVSLIVCDSHGNYSACSFTEIMGSFSCQAFTHDVPSAPDGFLYFAYPENSCHPLRFNSDVNCSPKPALKYSLVELDALSSPIMLYICCRNLLGWCLSPPLACKLIQHWTLSYLSPCCFRGCLTHSRCPVKVSRIFQGLPISGTQGPHWRHSVTAHHTHFSSLVIYY